MTETLTEVCENCGKAFETAAQLRGHNMQCRPPEKEPIQPRDSRRTERIPLDHPSSRIDLRGYKEKSDEVLRIVNDEPGRLRRFEKAGYTYIEDPEMETGGGIENTRDPMSTKVRFVVGKNEDGSPLMGYLMKQNKDWYDEDQARKQARIDELEADMMKGHDDRGTPGQDGRYIPKQIGITHQNEMKNK